MGKNIFGGVRIDRKVACDDEMFTKRKALQRVPGCTTARIGFLFSISSTDEPVKCTCDSGREPHIILRSCDHTKYL